MIKREEIMSMTEEQKKELLLNSMSESVKEMANRLAMLKAIARAEAEISPEDFDNVLKRELDKEWEKLKDLNSMQLALVAAADLMMKGRDVISDMMEEDE